MDTYLWPLVSYCLFITINRQRKKDIFETNISFFLCLIIVVKDGMKPAVTDKFPCYQIYVKTNIYLFIIILYNSSITDICTLQIIPYLVCHKPTNWDSDNHTLL